MTPLDRLTAEADIARLVLRYAALIDDGDFDRAAGLFTEAGVLVRPSGGEPIIGRANILTAFKARSPRLSRHLIANVLVDALSETEARCRSSMLLYTGAPGAAPVKANQPTLLGGFADTLVRENGIWLFAERRGWLDLVIGE